MPVVSGAEFLKATRKGGYTVGGYNTNNLEWTQAILGAVEARKTPVLIQTSIGAIKYMGDYKVTKDTITNLIDSVNITVPIAIHLDHGDYEAALECIEVGYTSIVFNDSHSPFEKNLELAKDVIEKAHTKGIPVEYEVGSVGGEEDGIIGTGELADTEECKRMVATDIDYLAYGISGIHGWCPENWGDLAFDHLQAIAKAVGSDVPLVLHGGSGIPQEQIEEAISVGTSKVNVNTEFRPSFAKTMREYIEAGKDLGGERSDPRKLLTPGRAVIIRDAGEHIDWSGSANKA